MDSHLQLCFLCFFICLLLFIIFDIMFGFLAFFCVGCTNFRRKPLILDDFWGELKKCRINKNVSRFFNSQTAERQKNYRLGRINLRVNGMGVKKICVFLCFFAMFCDFLCFFVFCCVFLCFLVFFGVVWCLENLMFLKTVYMNEKQSTIFSRTGLRIVTLKRYAAPVHSNSKLQRA